MKRVKYRKRTNYRRTSNNNGTYGRKLNKKKVFMVFAIFCLIIISIVKLIKGDDEKITEASGNEIPSTIAPSSTEDPNNTMNPIDMNSQEEPVEIDDWRLTLANYENILPEDFTVELAQIDENREFDARAIDYLKDLINDMRKDGISNIWVQSAYRSVQAQKILYENSINKYIKQGETEEEAERLTLEYINKPGTSEHNLGLAVDFNYVTNDFDKTEAFRWLRKNAENYGFILRYPKEKEDITKIEYEPWHWRYVGEEHAKKINELDMCLEEYVEYLQKN